MSKLSKKTFLEKYSTFPNFHKKILKQGGVKWSLLIEHPKDYYAADSGSVPGMIYYTDTVGFARENHLQILKILDDFENECGQLKGSPTPTDETQYFNWLSWFAWESMMSEISSFIENRN
ncbi:hypothetical protein SHK09_07505 [Polaribacter sp. PL03]|uniref:DUF7222 domain-containing protein n=1 Tax=Polaribacter sp. PL03 TaxID=3088353 RepID=UPI0029D35B4E|nr:hypothetical protein [Polaribacter sp. PL03]MDX6746634.1 hypothetical protein [Polaribacter sp. PL03]